MTREQVIDNMLADIILSANTIRAGGGGLKPDQRAVLRAVDEDLDNLVEELTEE